LILNEGALMRILLNGEIQETSAEFLADLLNQMDISREGLIVEINGMIIPREDWNRYELKQEMKIELIKFVGGG